MASEGLVRNLPVFSEFLNIASLSDTHPVNYSNIARECGVSSQTVRGYFEILEDTLMARWLPSYRKRPKRRVIHSPKLYFADVGIVGFLARRGRLEAGSELFGNAFESWCFHEITAYNCYAERFANISYWRLASGIEVDFVINDMAVAIEAKSSRHHLLPSPHWPQTARHRSPKCRTSHRSLPGEQTAANARRDRDHALW